MDRPRVFSGSLANRTRKLTGFEFQDIRLRGGGGGEERSVVGKTKMIICRKGLHRYIQHLPGLLLNGVEKQNYVAWPLWSPAAAIGVRDWTICDSVTTSPTTPPWGQSRLPGKSFGTNKPLSHAVFAHPSLFTVITIAGLKE